MTDKRELPELDITDEDRISAQDWTGHLGPVRPVREELSCRERHLSAALARAEKAEADLLAMTEDRNLWQGEHDENCPNVARVEAAEAEGLEQARLLGMSGSREAALVTKCNQLEKERDGWKFSAELRQDVADALNRKALDIRADLEKERDRYLAVAASVEKESL